MLQIFIEGNKVKVCLIFRKGNQILKQQNKFCRIYKCCKDFGIIEKAPNMEAGVVMILARAKINKGEYFALFYATVELSWSSSTPSFSSFSSITSSSTFKPRSLYVSRSFAALSGETYNFLLLQ